MASSWRPKRDRRISDGEGDRDGQADERRVVEAVVVAARRPRRRRGLLARRAAGEGEVRGEQLEDEEDRDRDDDEGVATRRAARRGRPGSRRSARNEPPSGTSAEDAVATRRCGGRWRAPPGCTPRYRRTRRARARGSPSSPRTMFHAVAEAMKISVNTAIEVIVGLVKIAGKATRNARTPATRRPARPHAGARAGEGRTAALERDAPAGGARPLTAPAPRRARRARRGGSRARRRARRRTRRSTRPATRRRRRRPPGRA